MLAIVNALGTLMAGLCAFLLLRGYARVRQRLLLWSGLCFAGLAVSNAVLFFDLAVVPAEISLYTWRLAIAAGSMLLLLYGLIFESD
ncbi:MAG TPA: DUF5985 family protein [Steroidobacteraceae bacterium]|nr:DUF5985 family protein [Steroidobacteraceae bacterium]